MRSTQAWSAASWICCSPPFDLTVIDVEYQGRAMGRAVPHIIGRHVHPAVKPGAAAPVDATGIDYLHLLEQAHQADVGQAINYLALAADDIEQLRHDQTRPKNA